MLASPVVELSVLASPSGAARGTGGAQAAGLHATTAGLEPPAGCHLEGRAPAGGARSKLCYWFHISPALTMRMNGSSWAGGQAERLVEAELHVFKLLPDPFALGQPEERRVEEEEEEVGSLNGAAPLSVNTGRRRLRLRRKSSARNPGRQVSRANELAKRTQSETAN